MILNSLDFWSLIIDGSVLSSVAEIAFKPMKDPPLISYDLVSKERYYD